MRACTFRQSLIEKSPFDSAGGIPYLPHDHSSTGPEPLKRADPGFWLYGDDRNKENN